MSSRPQRPLRAPRHDCVGVSAPRPTWPRRPRPEVRLVARIESRDDRAVDEPPLDRQTVDDMIRLLMRIDAGVEELLALFGEDEEDETDA